MTGTEREKPEEASEESTPSEGNDVESEEARRDDVDEASEQSFPASDPPSY